MAKRVAAHRAFAPRFLAVEQLQPRLLLDAQGVVAPEFFGPTPYLSLADRPAGFVCGQCEINLEDFEDGELDPRLEITPGEIIPPRYGSGLPNLTDSVDADDGVIDGSGQTNDGGSSWYVSAHTIHVNFDTLVTSAGLVWTDGDPRETNVVFEAFDQDGNSLGRIEAGPLGDSSIQGTTAEDRFFGVRFGDGVTTGIHSMRITNEGFQGIEIDHVQWAICPPCDEVIDLELDKSVIDAERFEGGTVTWQIVVTNNPETANTAASGVTIGDLLPVGISFVSASVSSGTYDPATGIWTLGSALEPGAAATLKLQTSVDAGTAGQTLMNTAQVLTANESDFDSVPGNDDGDQSEDDEDKESVAIREREGVVAISGFSYVDVNNDGVFQEYESPLLGVEIQLMGIDSRGEAVMLATFTDIDGFYQFSELLPGTYMVKQVQPVQFVDGKDTLGNLGGDGSVDDKFTVTLDQTEGVHYNFGELGLRPEFVNKRFYLTSTPYSRWSAIDVRESSVWYSFQANQRTLFTSLVDATEGTAIVELFSREMAELPPLTGLGETETQWDLAGDGPYYLRLSGSSSSVTLAVASFSPGVQQIGDSVYVDLDEEDNSVEVNLRNDLYVLNIGGLVYEYEPAAAANFYIHGRGGNDSINVLASALNDKATVDGDHSSVGSDAYRVSSYEFETTRIYSGGGHDVATAYDTPGNDRLFAHPGQVVLASGEIVNQIRSFDQVNVYATRGGNDYGRFYDSAGDDLFVGKPEYAYLRSAGYVSYAKGFDRIDAFATTGNDVARLYDSAGDDIFVGKPEFAYLKSAQHLNYAQGFDRVDAFASTGNDTATFVDSAGDDRFVGRQNLAYMKSASYLNTAGGFDSYSAAASRGGHDTARLLDVRTADRLAVTASKADLRRSACRQTLDGFDFLLATADKEQTPALDLQAIDFALETEGDWI